ncbi:uncharacterized protein LOC129579346 [Sitodiplosis mosellana]|uniref:uncharacterized protein LOC129579346 n=1 Tax=Sitodiplosis mosellana TaxID=263140 RepID=UPI002443920E|nr:uncharacterized protein LOC129579346 [Sitodiplosis mosellana]
MSMNQIATDICEPEFQPEVVWDMHNNVSAREIQADPMCLDELKMNILRRCNDGVWIPQPFPNCYSTQKPFEKSESCPLNYTTISKNDVHLCVLLTEPTDWQNQCIYDGSSVTFYDLNASEQKVLINYLNAKNVKEVWLPGKRFSRFGPVIWTIGELNGEQVEFDKLNVDLIDEMRVAADGCFSAFVHSNLTTGTIKECHQKLNLLCLFRRNTDHTGLLSTGCPKNGFTVSYQSSDHYCHSIQMIDKGRLSGKKSDGLDKLIETECKGDLFTMDSVEKTNIFKQLASVNSLRNSEHCLFAVAPNSVYVTDVNNWKTVIERVNYVNWDHPLRNGTYLATNKHGKWNWIDQSFDCLVCSMPIKMYEPEIVLNFDKVKRRLYVTVYNEEFMWRTLKTGVKCFTNADDELIRTVEIGRKKWSGMLSIEQINQKVFNESRLRKRSKAIYELKLNGEGPGYYWCEGYTMLQFDLIQSAKVVAFRREKGEVFATLINTVCKDCRKFFLKNFIKHYAKKFRDLLKDNYKIFKKSNEYSSRFENAEINIENVRIMKIEDISSRPMESGMYKMRILCHVSVSIERHDDFEEFSRIIQIHEILENLFQHLPPNEEFGYVSLNSTEYCLPESNQTVNGGLSWISAKIGETIPPNQLCLLSNGLPALRSCVGDFLYGGVWQYATQQECHRKPDQLTEKLFELSTETSLFNKMNNHAIQNISTLLQKNSQKMNVVAADLFYLGRIMSDFSRLNNKNSINTFNLSDTQHVFSIYNNLMYLNENTTRKSAALNSTNILLDAFDNILNGIQIGITSVANNRNSTIVNSDDGTITTQTPNLIVYVIDPSIKNVSGVALIKKSQQSNDESNDFTDYYIKTLYSNQSSDELLNDERLEIATFVPNSLLDLLNATTSATTMTTTVAAMMNNETEECMTSPIKIVISIYYNDRLFQEYRKGRHAKSTGRIISVSIPGYGPNLPALLPTFVRSRNAAANASGSMCGYWDFEKDFATWSDDGCEFLGKSSHLVDPVVLCACSHLTHYSYLIVGTVFQPTNAIEDEVIITKTHQKALDIITLLGCLLSLLGVCGIAITAIFFRTWRKKASSVVLLQLSAAIALQMILLCFVNTEYSSMVLVMEQRFIVCVALGALLQYSILVAFSWMLITAYLQFMRYVIVLGPKRANRFFLKSFLIGWGLPLVPVLIVTITSPNSYVQSVGDSNSGGICYPSGSSLYFGLILPIGVIMLANLTIFLLVIYSILAGSSAKIRSNKRALIIAQLRLSVFLFFLLGLSWIFGFLASIKSGIIFSYLFCLTATIQGFVLFVYFIILDAKTRELWRNLFFNTCWCHKKL